MPIPRTVPVGVPGERRAVYDPRMSAADPETWLVNTAAGLYCVPGGFHIDPMRAVDRAVITHGHADHARAGHRHVLATPETLAVMRVRLGPRCAETLEPLETGAECRVGEVTLRLAPAGHVLGSAQVVMEHGGARAVVTGDYKRRPDPTCRPFQPVPCDLFVTEATFGLPVYRHPEAGGEVARLLAAMALQPERTFALGAYSLGKAQRLLALIRAAGETRPAWIHPALARLCDVYAAFGLDLGELRPVDDLTEADLPGALVMAPPDSLPAAARGRPGAPPMRVQASGWFGVRARTRQREVDLPLVISDHADWTELTDTILEVGAPRVWIMHGPHAALAHWAGGHGIAARPLPPARPVDDAA